VGKLQPLSAARFSHGIERIGGAGGGFHWHGRPSENVRLLPGRGFERVAQPLRRIVHQGTQPQARGLIVAHVVVVAVPAAL
jgi:hypothetical protein